MSKKADNQLSRARRHDRPRAAHAAPETQIKETKRERAPMSLFKRLLIVAVVVALVGTVAFFLSRYLDGSWRAKEAINQAISHIGEADETIVELNEMVTSTVDEADATQAQNLIDDLGAASESLKKADDSLAEANALDEFMDDNQRALCDAIRDSIDARRTMFGASETILSVDVQVGSARAYLEQTIEKALKANEKAQEATKAANEYAQFLTGDTSVATQDASVATNLDTEAIALIDEAKAALASAKEAFADADYSAYETYLDKRAEALTIVLEADNALVSGDFSSTGEKTDAYNTADAAATEAAAALPATTTEIFTAPYDTLTAGSRKTYSEAALKAADADALIRHYEGVNVSTSQYIVDTVAATTIGAKNGS